MPQKVIYKDLGLIDYKECWDYQETLFNGIVQRKIEERKHPEKPGAQPEHYLLFCEHPHVYTLGKSGDASHMLVNEQGLKQHNATYYKINRGGDITYHGPGQIVGYPILDLDHFFTDIHKYLRFLEEAVIKTIAEYGLEGNRYPGYTGVWLDPDNDAKARKICAIGVRTSRWVTMHGFAFNVNTNLSYFNHIVPCGIENKQVTSMEKELGKKVDFEEVKEKLKSHLATIFEMDLVEEKEAV